MSLEPRALPVVVPDPHVVYQDAVFSSPWNFDDGAHLPQRDDWSTFRYAVKDVILGVATHRYDRASRRLEVRAYFSGEHPAYKTFEPTRIMFLVLSSQAWQVGRRMELYFKEGIPWDLRLYFEELLGERISGHVETIPHELASRLYVRLADVPSALVNSIEGRISPEHLCFHVFRGTWSERQVRGMWRRGVPLDWVFRARPDPIRDPFVYIHLLRHLSALVLEDHALARLSGREEGARPGLSFRCGPDDEWLESPEPIALSGPDRLTFLAMSADEPFVLIPVLERTVQGAAVAVAEGAAAYPSRRLVFTFPLDLLASTEAELKELSRLLDQMAAMRVIVGLTLLQLKTEVELNIAVTALQADELEVRDAWETRYAE